MTYFYIFYNEQYTKEKNTLFSMHFGCPIQIFVDSTMAMQGMNRRQKITGSPTHKSKTCHCQ